MVAAFQIDTLAYAKKLKDAGADERLAEAIVEGLTNADTSTLATKEDLRETKDELRSEIHQFRDELRGEIHKFRDELRGEIHEVRDELREVKASQGEMKVELLWIKGIGGAILLLNAYPILAKLLS